MAIQTAEDFYRAVKLMREAQKFHRETNSFSASNTAKRHEAEVDRFIKERDERLAEKKQGNLFKGAAE